MSAAKPVISSVPTTAAPMPSCSRGKTFGGIVLLVRNCQLIAPTPLAITVKGRSRAEPGWQTKASHITKVAIWFLARRQPPGSRRSTCCCSEATAIRRPPSCAATCARTKPRADRLTRIVITNSNRPRPMSAERNTPGGLAELVRDDPGHGVARGEQVRRDVGEEPITRATAIVSPMARPSPSSDGADHAALAVRPDGAADHLPAGRAERVRALLVGGRHGRDDLP